MVLADLVPGDYSSAGRATGRHLSRLRTKVKIDEAGPGRDVDGAFVGSEGASPKSPAFPASPQSVLADALRLDVAASPTGRPRSSMSAPGSAERLAENIRASLSGTAVGGGASGHPGRSSSSDLGDASADDLELTVRKERPSIAFTCMGQDKPRYCDMAGANLGRFAFPAKLDQRPEIGRYEVLHGDRGTRVVQERNPEWDFAARPRHQSRKELDMSLLEKDPFGAQDQFDQHLSSFHRASCTSPKAREQLRRSRARPPLEKCQGRTYHDRIQMSEPPLGAKDWNFHDLSSSKRPRVPDWSFEKHAGSHRVEIINTTYEPAKYAVSWSCVESPVKSGLSFDLSLSRSASAGHTGRGPGQLGLGSPKAPKDRSLARDCPLTRQRVVRVSNFTKELSRPPLEGNRSAYHDEQDPEANEAVLQRSLTFDASIADRAVIPRSDIALRMCHSLTRERAGRGDRIFQADNGLRMAKGIGHHEGRTALEASVEQAKEVPSRCRPDMGMTFDQAVGREDASPKTRKTYSSLRQPRELAAPDFARNAPLPGFATRASIPRTLVPARHRAHEADPRWQTECLDEAEIAPPP